MRFFLSYFHIAQCALLAVYYLTFFHTSFAQIAVNPAPSLRHKFIAEGSNILDNRHLSKVLNSKITTEDEIGNVIATAASNRPNCAQVFEEECNWNDRSNLCEMAFYVFLLLPFDKSGIVNEGHNSTLKMLLSTLDTVRDWEHYGISLKQVESVGRCNADPILGRTIGMKLVQLGLSSAIRTPFAQTYLFSRDTLSYVDNQGNNLIHLAAMSENLETLDAVLSLLYRKTAKQHEGILTLLDAKNYENQTPLEAVLSPSISTNHYSLAMREKLKGYYRTLSILGMVRNSTVGEYGIQKLYLDQ